MTHGLTVVEKGSVEYGYHTHKLNQGECQVCERENEAFRRLLKVDGTLRIVEKMRSLKSYQSYNQHWPFDERKKVLSMEAILEESENENKYVGEVQQDSTTRVMDEQAVDELLAELTPRQAHVIRLTVENFKPRDIAAEWGEVNSNRVRQDKYAALRILGAPVNTRMRRNGEQ